jgi:hypothetical protein
MSRPKPRVLLESVDDNGRALQVCDADAVYAVCYQGMPIMLKTYADINSNYIGPKYNKTSFPNAAHAFNLATRLNERFGTDHFTVAIMDVKRIISEK